jgi:hypothetical protein
MNIPHEKVKIFYHGKSAFAFKQRMEDYRKKYNLSDIYSPKIKVTDSHQKGKFPDPNMYTITYYEFDAKQLRPELPINKIIVRSTSMRKAQEAFYKITKDRDDVAFVRAIKRNKVPDTKFYEYVVEWRKAIYRNPKRKIRG